MKWVEVVVAVVTLVAGLVEVALLVVSILAVVLNLVFQEVLALIRVLLDQVITVDQFFMVDLDPLEGQVILH